MQDWEKSREQLIDELKEMRLKVYKLDNAQIDVDNITEQQHALNELKNIRDYYRELVEYTNSIIVRWDREGKITFLNKFGQTFFGYSAEEILGRDAIGTIVPETDQAGRNLQQMIRDISVHPERYEKNQNENMRRNGERVWISWTNMPIFDEHGNVREVVSIGNDHTDLRLAEEELRKSKEDLETRVIERTAKLRESEEKYRLLFESAPIGITLVNREGEVLEVNRAVLEMLGSPGADATKTINMLSFPPLVEAGISDLFRTCMVENRPIDREIFYTSKWGKQICMRAILTPKLSEHGNVEGCLAVMEDVMPRKMAEQAHKESEEKFRIIFRDAPVGMMSVSKSGEILEANRRMLDILGSPGMEHTSKINMITFPPIIEAGIAEHYRRCVTEGLPADFESAYTTKWGKKTYLRSVLTPRFDEKGEIVGCLTVIEDVMPRKMAEQALNESESQFKTLFEAAQDCIFIKDKQLRHVDVNPPIAELLQMERSDIIGKTSQEVFGDGYPSELEDVELRVLQGQIVETLQNMSYKSEQIILNVIRFPLRDSSGEIIGLCGIARERVSPTFPQTESSPEMVGFSSASMRSALEKAGFALENSSIVLLTGETGSGKDYLARYIHEHSLNSVGPFYTINCAAIPPELAESELFGHEVGAYTHAVRRKRGMLELAEGGTLLLNEIGELPAILQAKLLTFLDTRSFTRVGGEKSISVTTRLIAATNRDLEIEVNNGRFRKDLYYRLSVLVIEVPPLRDRQEDVPLIANQLLKSICEKLYIHPVPEIQADALRALSNYNWPGNVRELRNVLERALIISKGNIIRVRHLGLGGPLWGWERPSIPPGRSLYDVIGETERLLIEDALQRAEGKKREAAILLGISRYALARHMSKLGISEQ